MNDIRTILVTTDLSDTSKKCFAPVKMLAEKFGSRIVVVHVEEDRLPPLVIEYSAAGYEEIRQRQELHAREQLAEQVAEGLGADREVETLVVSGIPHAEIVRLAEKIRPDLIVMAPHGRGFISHALLGSTTDRVMRHAPCPVLVVREPEEKEK